MANWVQPLQQPSSSDVAGHISTFSMPAFGFGNPLWPFPSPPMALFNNNNGVLDSSQMPNFSPLLFQMPSFPLSADHQSQRSVLWPTPTESGNQTVDLALTFPSMFSSSSSFDEPLLAAPPSNPRHVTDRIPFYLADKPKPKPKEEKDFYIQAKRRPVAIRLGQLTYADMIEQSIILSRQSWLPVSAIYSQFERNFPEFTAKHPRWQDCIRRTLTINRSRFQRQERTSGVARLKRGPGGFWGLVGTPVTRMSKPSLLPSSSSPLPDPVVDECGKSSDQSNALEEDEEEITPHALSPVSSCQEDAEGDDVAKILLSLSSTTSLTSA